jgi:hypothetical protein
MQNQSSNHKNKWRSKYDKSTFSSIDAIKKMKKKWVINKEVLFGKHISNKRLSFILHIYYTHPDFIYIVYIPTYEDTYTHTHTHTHTHTSYGGRELNSGLCSC